MQRTAPPNLLPEQATAEFYSSQWLEERQAFQPSTEPASDFAHALFAPMHYETGYAYPLVVWLHGPRSNEEELWQVMPLVSLRNHVAVAPRGNLRDSSCRGAFGWDQVSEEGIADALERVTHCLDMAQDRFHVHPERIFLAGYAEGGTLALRLGLENPALFAGAISLGGPVPRGHCPLKGINAARQLPLLLSVSPEEGFYPDSRVTDDLRLLHAAGCSLSLRLYPPGDRLTTSMLEDVDAWILEQFCSASAATTVR